MKKNILLIIESSETGGAEKVFAELVLRIDRAKFVPYVALLYKGWLYNKLVDEGITVHLIPNRKGGFDIKMLRGIFTLIREYEIDLIHSHLFTTNVYACVCGAVAGVPVISTFHGIMDVDIENHFNWLKWQVINRLSYKIVFVSNYLRDYFVKHKMVYTSKTQVIYNGIDIKHFQSGCSKTLARLNLGLLDSSYIIGCVGDLRDAKDYQSAIRATKQLKQSIPSVKLIIAGTITEMQYELNSLIQSLGLVNDVYFLGFRSDIENIFPAFDVYLSSSTSEGFSLTVVEAMAARLPVVATRSGGPEEIVLQGETGLLVEIGCPEKIAFAVEMIYRNQALAKSLALKGALLAEDKFSIKAMINAYQSKYQNATSRHKVCVHE